mmetsp:Transcript_42356/g.134586  ORF Transcript_42356/g.134586 Transcript_42356/m.134586 type:complete len:314 (-) Transcript_42356:189-1130(-)
MRRLMKMTSGTEACELLLMHAKAEAKAAAKFAEKSAKDARQIHSTCQGGRMDSPKCSTEPKCSSGACSWPALPGVPGGEGTASAPPCGSRGRLRSPHQPWRRLKSCWICAAGRATLDAILYSCHCLRRSSWPQFARQQTWPSSSGGSRSSTARARPSPSRCCRSAMAVTSSTPAGTSAKTSLLWRWKPSHHSALPMAGLPGEPTTPRSSRSSACSPGWWLQVGDSPVSCRVRASADRGRPSAICRKPVSASFRVDQSASVFQGELRPCSGRTPASKTWPSKAGPTTSVSGARWSISRRSTAGVQRTSRDWKRM